jgi:hypothetical protein
VNSDASDAGAEPTGSSPGPERGGGRQGDSREGSDPADDKGGTGVRTTDNIGLEEGEQAYQRGRRLFGANTILQAGRDVQVGDRIKVVTGKSTTSGPGPVPREQLAELRALYVRIPNYDVLQEVLRTRRLLILVGPPGSGRTTTALHLLDELTDGRVLRLASDAELREIDDEYLDDTPGCLAEPANTRQLTATEADRLADLCVRHDSYLVVVVPADPTGRRTTGSYAKRCEVPVAPELLAAHLETLVRSSDPSGTEQWLAALASSEDLWAAVGPDPRPAAVARLAALLVGHARDGGGLDDVRQGCEEFVTDMVAEWFGVLRDELHGRRAEQVRRGIAQRIALAVFDEQPRSFTADVGDDLADLWQLRTRTQGRATRPTGPAETDDVLLASIGAELVSEQVRYRGSWQAATVVRFTDERVPRAVLHHVWRHEVGLRQVMTAWLHRLVGDGDRALGIMAGQVVGYLCTIDFTYTFGRLVEPNARALRRHASTGAEGADAVESSTDNEDEDDDRHLRRRRFAAVALDQAARDPALADPVARLLKRWRRSEEVTLRWTVASALGLDFGLATIDETLEELRILGTPQEMTTGDDLDDDGWDLVFVAGSSIARLFSRGAERPVVRVLERWIRHDRSSLRLLAIQAVLLLADQSRATVPVGVCEADADAHVDDPRSSWPVLIEAARRDPVLAGPLALLLRGAIRSRPGGRPIEKVLGRWIGKTQEDAEFLAALEDFLPLLVIDGGDRNRLRYVVERRRHDWAEPLRPEIAARLLNCAAGARTREVPA